MVSNKWEIVVHGDYQFNASQWFAVNTNMWDLNNWRLIEEFSVVPEECK